MRIATTVLLLAAFAAGVSAEQKRLREQLEKWTFDAERQTKGVGVRQHPLGYVGVALAGANDPTNDGILTGLRRG